MCSVTCADHHHQVCLHTMAVKCTALRTPCVQHTAAQDLGLCRLSSGRPWPETRLQQQKTQLSRQLLQSASCSRWRHRAA